MGSLRVFFKIRPTGVRSSECTESGCLQLGINHEDQHDPRRYFRYAGADQCQPGCDRFQEAGQGYKAIPKAMGEGAGQRPEDRQGCASEERTAEMDREKEGGI